MPSADLTLLPSRVSAWRGEVRICVSHSSLAFAPHILLGKDKADLGFPLSSNSSVSIVSYGIAIIIRESVISNLERNSMVEFPQVCVLILMGTKQFGKLFLLFLQNRDVRNYFKNFSWQTKVLPFYFVFTFVV